MLARTPKESRSTHVANDGGIDGLHRLMVLCLRRCNHISPFIRLHPSRAALRQRRLEGLHGIDFGYATIKAARAIEVSFDGKCLPAVIA